jgi:epoxide hydrolase
MRRLGYERYGVQGGDLGARIAPDAIRRSAERANHIVHWSDFDRGGHFAALEEPDLLVGDIRRFFAAAPVRNAA